MQEIIKNIFLYTIFLFPSLLLGDCAIAKDPKKQSIQDNHTGKTVFSSLIGIEKGNSGYVVLSIYGCMYYSDSGTTWFSSSYDIPTNKEAKNIAWLEDRYFAVGYDGFIVSSENGKKWKINGCGSDNERCLNEDVSAIAKYNGKYIVVGNRGIAYSENLDKWYYSVGGSRSEYSYLFYSLTIGNGEVIAVGPSIYVSKNGEIWNRVYSRYRVKKVVWDGVQYAAITDNAVLVSEDLSNWRNVYDAPSGVVLNVIDFENDIYFIAGNNGFIARSHNLNKWIRNDLGLSVDITDMVVEYDNYTVTTDYSENFIDKDGDSKIVKYSRNHFGGIYTLSDTGVIRIREKFEGDINCDVAKSDRLW